jgi:hypothetical protein
LWTFGIQPNVAMLSSVTHSAFAEVQYVYTSVIIQPIEYPTYTFRLSVRLLVEQLSISVQTGGGLNM